MARIARKKTENAIYHVRIIGCKSKPLFNNEYDKKMFMEKLSESIQKYKFKVYAYCLMDTHVHLIVDSYGTDISVIMKSVKERYSKYYNKEHDSNGSLYKERFESTIIESDGYLIAASLYIHRNPKDIVGYRNTPETYKFSSIKAYSGGIDEFDIVDSEFILSILNRFKYFAVKDYIKLFNDTMNIQNNKFKELEIKLDMEFKNVEYVNNREILKRNFSVSKLAQFIVEEIGLEVEDLLIKNRSYNKELRALFALMATSLCGISSLKIGKVLGGITTSRVCTLTNYGIELIRCNSNYSNIFKKFMEKEEYVI
ncbi:transposase [Clostridium senegalense]